MADIFVIVGFVASTITIYQFIVWRGSGRSSVELFKEHSLNTSFFNPSQYNAVRVGDSFACQILGNGLASGVFYFGITTYDRIVFKKRIAVLYRYQDNRLTSWPVFELSDRSPGTRFGFGWIIDEDSLTLIWVGRFIEVAKLGDQIGHKSRFEIKLDESITPDVFLESIHLDYREFSLHFSDNVDQAWMNGRPIAIHQRRLKFGLNPDGSFFSKNKPVSASDVL